MRGRIAATIALIVGFGTASAVRAQQSQARRAPFDLRALFTAVGQMYDLDPDLLAAIAAVESGDRANAISPKGAAGLMQLMPATARRYHVGDAFDPVASALGAARLLADLRRGRRAGEAPNLPELIAAYNAGEGAVERFDGIPPYPETELYVRRVLKRYLLAAHGTSVWVQAAPSSAARGKGDGALLDQLARLRRDRARAERGGSGG